MHTEETTMSTPSTHTRIKVARLEGFLIGVVSVFALAFIDMAIKAS